MTSRSSRRPNVFRRTGIARSLASFLGRVFGGWRFAVSYPGSRAVLRCESGGGITVLSSDPVPDGWTVVLDGYGVSCELELRSGLIGSRPDLAAARVADMISRLQSFCGDHVYESFDSFGVPEYPDCVCVFVARDQWPLWNYVGDC